MQNHLNINNLPNENNNYRFSIPKDIKTGVKIGIAKVASDIVFDNNLTSSQALITKNFCNALSTHTIFQGMLRLDPNFVIPEEFNEKTGFIKDFISANIGAVCGVLATKGIDIFQTSICLDNQTKKLVNDFTLLCGFVAVQCKTKNDILPKLNNLECMQALENNPSNKIKMIDKKSVKFFVDSISGMMGSLAVSYVSPLISSPTDDIATTARNGLILGSVFSAAKNATHNLITRAYNYFSTPQRDLQEREISLV